MLCQTGGTMSRLGFTRRCAFATIWLIGAIAIGIAWWRTYLIGNWIGWRYRFDSGLALGFFSYQGKLVLFGSKETPSFTYSQHSWWDSPELDEIHPRGGANGFRIALVNDSLAGNGFDYRAAGFRI